MYALINIIIFVVSGLVLIVDTSFAQECTSSRGKLSDVKKLWQDFDKIFEEVCEKSNNVVPKAFVKETTNCYEKHIKPCLRIKAPIIMKALKDCVEDKKLKGGDKVCDQETQDEVTLCGIKWLTLQNNKILSAFTPNIGLLSEKGKLFKKCIKGISKKILNPSQ